MQVDRDVARLVTVDALHGLLAHRIGDVVVERPKQRDVEDQLAAGDVGVGDVIRQVAKRVHEVRREPQKMGIRLVDFVIVTIEMVGEHHRDVAMPRLVLDAVPKDPLQHRVVRTPSLGLEERAGQALDSSHIGEVLDDGELVLS